jgi:CBS domain-containing protein
MHRAQLALIGRIVSTAWSVVALFLVAAGVFRLLDGDPGGAWYVLIGWLVKKASAARYRKLRLDEALRGVVVRDLMLEAVTTMPGSGTVAEAARDHFMRTGYGSYPVTRGGNVVGLLSLKDVLRLSAKERESISVQGAMRPLTDAIVTEPDAALSLVFARMARTRAAALLVMHGEQLVGLLTMSAVLRSLRVREELET